MSVCEDIGVPSMGKKCHTRTVCLFASEKFLVVYYESRKRDLKTRPIYECRCAERLKAKPEKF